jgi:hypothetical protein
LAAIGSEQSEEAGASGGRAAAGLCWRSGGGLWGHGNCAVGTFRLSPMRVAAFKQRRRRLE